MEQRLLLEINKPVSRKRTVLLESKVTTKFDQTAVHVELDAELQNQMSWVEGPKPVRASSFKSTVGQDGDGWDLYIGIEVPGDLGQEVIFIKGVGCPLENVYFNDIFSTVRALDCIRLNYTGLYWTQLTGCIFTEYIDISKLCPFYNIKNLKESGQ